MKKAIVSLITIMILLTGCSEGNETISSDGNSSQSVQVNNFDEILLKDASRYLDYPDSKTPNLKENVVAFLIENKNKTSQPEKFDQLAQLINVEDIEGATEIFLELGGEQFLSRE